jgi:hypothetical protein
LNGHINSRNHSLVSFTRSLITMDGPPFAEYAPPF